MLLPFSSLVVALLLGSGVDRNPEGSTGPGASQPRSHFTFRAEPPISEVRVGDAAPNFSFQGFDGRWTRLHHLVDQGPVLLVFGLNESQMTALERERNDLLSLGVIPVAIVDCNPGQARNLVRHLGLRFTVLADSRLVIAPQFNAAEAGRLTPSWFVIDNRLRVRALFRGRLPSEDYVRVCARALALPMPGGIVQTSRPARKRP